MGYVIEEIEITAGRSVIPLPLHAKVLAVIPIAETKDSVKLAYCYEKSETRIEHFEMILVRSRDEFAPNPGDFEYVGAASKPSDTLYAFMSLRVIRRE